MINSYRKSFGIALVSLAFVLGACGGGSSAAGGGGSGGGGGTQPVSTDTTLRNIIAAEGLTGDPSIGRNLPSINDPIPQLGKKLFFSKSLSGDLDTACASCHHPALGGADGLSLPVGTGAVDPDVVGLGRTRSDGLPNVGRHSQSVFNAGLWDAALFFDSRTESIGKEAGLNGAGSGIRTPDTALDVADTNAGDNLPAAQARFPVTVPEEMLGDLMPTASGDEVRDHLAARIGDYGTGLGELSNNNWLAEFQTAFVSAESAEQLITYDNIAFAIAEYQRSMVFVDTPWKAYVEGNNNALTEEAKQGAILFYGDPANGGLGCNQCHSGDFFTDEEPHTVAVPQIGPGKGDGDDGDADFGREQQTALADDRFRFRTATLLNLDAAPPFGHAGVYDNLLEAVGHYVIPESIFSDFRDRGGVCSIPQFTGHPDCGTLYPRVGEYFGTALNKVLMERTTDPDLTFPDLSNSPLSDAPKTLAFLGALNDPCTTDRSCLAPWIPLAAEAPDDHQLNATDGDGNSL